jgi:hypothetical protein
MLMLETIEDVDTVLGARRSGSNVDKLNLEGYQSKIKRLSWSMKYSETDIPRGLRVGCCRQR